MAGEKLQGPFSFKVAKKILSQGDLDRLACAFLAMDNIHQVIIPSTSIFFSPSLLPPLPLPLALLLFHFPWSGANFLFQLFPLEKIVVQCQQSGLGIRRFEAG